MSESFVSEFSQSLLLCKTPGGEVDLERLRREAVPLANIRISFRITASILPATTRRCSNAPEVG